MLISLIFLTFLISIDSFSIGLTYGLRNTKINIFCKFILLLISFIFSSLSVLIGEVITNFLPEYIIPIISGFILILIGFLVIYDPIPFDFDHSKHIDVKEAIFLGITLSIDSVCVGIGTSIGNKFAFLYPILITIFNILFLSLGIYFGKKIIVNKNFSDKTLDIISGIFLIILGFSKILF